MKALYFIILMLAALGFFGGIGYILWISKSYSIYPIVLGMLALGYYAYPRAKEDLRKLLN